MKHSFDDSFDFSDFVVAAPAVQGSGAVIGGGSPPAPVLGAPIDVTDEVQEAEAAYAASGDGGPGSVVAVGGPTSAGLTINLQFDAAAMAAPQSFRDGITAAMQQICAVVTDKITVNIQIDYSGTGGGAAAGPTGGNFVGYSTVRADLVNNASPGDTTFNSLPTGSTIAGQSQVAVWYAQEKLWGLISPTGSEVDGSATFSTDINPNLLVGVALHELTHAMGRVPYGAQPDVFDFYRFTSAGNYLFNGNSTAPAAYFSLNGGTTKIADYGQTSDPSDFLNSGVQGSTDPFNEFYSGNTQQQLTAIDLKQLDALGFHLAATVQPKPDLIDYVQVNKTTVAAGSSVTIDAWAENLGNGASAGSTAQIYLSTDPTITTSDTVLATLTSGSLAVVGQPGYTDHQTVTVNLPGNLAPGTYYVGGIADYNNQVVESNESNNNYNVVQITVTGPGQPDLSEYVAVNKTTVSAGSSITIDAYDMNLGNAVSPGSTAGLYLSTDATITTSDTLLATVTNAESLATVSQPGYYDHQAVTVNLPANLAPGTYYVAGIADYNNQVVESNESNNTYNVVQITVTGAAGPNPPDLIEYVQVDKTTVAPGGSITVDAWVDNLGSGASPGSTAQIYLSTDPTITTSDTVLATLTSGSLAVVGQPGYTDHQTVTVNLPGNLAPGTYYVGGIADYNGHVGESNESNNNYNTVQITVTGAPQVQPDLIEYVEVNKTAVAAGGSITVDAWVDNLGSGASPGSTAQIYLSTDPTITTSDTVLATLTSGSLAIVSQPGYTNHQTFTVNLPANLAPGTYYVGGIADYNGHVAESNESNNNYNVVQITVGAPAAPSPNVIASVGNDNFSFAPDLGASSHSSAAPQTSGLPAVPVVAAGQDLASVVGAMAAEAQHMPLAPDSHDATLHVAALGGSSPADVHTIQTASGFIIH